MQAAGSRQPRVDIQVGMNVKFQCIEEKYRRRGR
jgi:hypothetical protein